MADTTIAADIIAGFLEILEEVGVSGTLTYYTYSGTEYNPTVTTATESITLVPVGYKIKEIDGTTIKQGDRKFLFLSTNVPKKDNKVTLDSVVYNVVNADIVAVSGVNVLYKVQGRE
jgi:hypothetical protein